MKLEVLANFKVCLLSHAIFYYYFSGEEDGAKEKNRYV